MIMKVKCRITGIEYTTTTFGFANIHDTVISTHPIMDARLEVLIEYYQLYQSDSLNLIERKLLFLALAKQTNLVTFTVASTVSDKIVQLNMEALLKTLVWVKASGNSFRLPIYNVSSDNANMNNFAMAIQAWNDAKTGWAEKNSFASVRLGMANAEDRLIKLINDYKTDTPAFARRLADWVIKVCDIGSKEINSAMAEAKQDYYRSLFQLNAKDLSVFNANADDLAEMYKTIHDTLADQPTSTFSIAAIRHVSNLVSQNNKGINWALGFEDDEDIDLFTKAEKNPYRIIHTHSEIIAEPDLPLPIKTDYPKLVDYLLAKARYEAQKFNKEEAARKLALEKKDDEIPDEFSHIDLEAETIINQVVNNNG